jgi:IgA Peptidase M64/Secretion system C-terminal sorting domain
MKKLFICTIILFSAFFAEAQVFEIQNIQYKGDKSKYINFVIMGDGFTASQQDLFITKAKALTDYLLNQAPWSNYKNFINVFAIKVISQQSGIKHPNTAPDCGTVSTVNNPNNYFGTTFDVADIHRLVAGNYSVINQVLATNFPDYDQALILANSTNYGGSGGSTATATINQSSFEIMAHELGHSFAGLSDEYYLSSGMQENVNVTRQSNPTLVKWKYWISPSNPDIGVFKYCCGGDSNLWHKPTDGKCKMELLGNNFCEVCNEAFIEKIHSLVNPIVNYTPSNLTTISSTNALIDFKLSELMKPIPNTLSIKWKLDTQVLNNISETYQVNQSSLTNGIHTLTATVVDNSNFVKINSHSLHINSVVWKINKTTLGVDTYASETKSIFSLYPNPTDGMINLSLELDKSSDIVIDLTTIDGKIIQNYANGKIDQGKFNNTINLENLQSGMYIVVFKIDGITYSKKIIKQ